MLEVLSEHLLLNPGSVTKQAAAGIALVLSPFPEVAVRTALASERSYYSGQLQIMRILRVLADIIWQQEGLPPPVEVCIEQIWEHLGSGGRGWAHRIIPEIASQYGWEALRMGEVETQATRKAQIRDIYNSTRDRIVGEWIARVTTLSADK